jgi:hypothetical protein
MLNKMKEDMGELIKLLADKGAKGTEAKEFILEALKNAKNNGTKLFDELCKLSDDDAHPTSFKFNLSLVLANIDKKETKIINNMFS